MWHPTCDTRHVGGGWPLVKISAPVIGQWELILCQPHQFRCKDNFTMGNLLVTHSPHHHQRMMVDPMFMIVQSLGSHLTAVTHTSVAPIAIILPVFSWIYLILPHFTWIYMNLHEFTWIFMNFHEFTNIYPIYMNLPKFT